MSDGASDEGRREVKASDAPGNAIAHAAKRRPNRTVLLSAFALAVIALFVGAVYATFLLTEARYAETTRMAAHLVEDSITRTLESTETTLLGVATMIRSVGSLETPQARQDMAILVDQSLRFAPYLRQIMIARCNGAVVFDSVGRVPEDGGHRINPIGLGLCDIEKGGATLSHTSLFRGLRIGPETPGRFLPLVDGPEDLSPRTIIPVAVMATPEVLVVGALNPASLRRILDDARFGVASAVRITRLDGTTVLDAEDPEVSVLRGRSVSLIDAARDGIEVGQKTLSDPNRMLPAGSATFRLSSRYPVAVVVAVARGDLVRQWLESTGSLLFWSVVSLLALGLGGAVLMRESMRRARLEGRLRLISLTEAVFAHTAEAMLVTDRNHRIQAANPTFLTTTGHHSETVIGATPDDFLTRATVATPEDGGEDPSGPPHWWLRRASGPPRAVELRGAPLGPDTTILTLNDITDRIAVQKALKDALREAELANRAKSEFLAAMSHELRTPLNAIIGFSEILRDEMFGPIGMAKYRTYAEDIHGSGSLLRDIINDLLDLAKIEAGRFELFPEPLDINAEIEGACRLVRERATNHGLTLTVAGCASAPTLVADRRVFQQILINVLTNAIKFTPRGGRISVSCEQDADGGLSVAVSDTGIGIALEEQARIFHTYERAINTETRHIEGSGLGLALVRSMMDLHGGRVSLQSAPNEGSTFTITFPPVPGDEADRSHAEPDD
ncbi:sensor histidine kinase [Rhodospira trueperi]|uniref:histidine kinase n=1 Tax=Rhodospira trueperi TaxID=69960 RepID=A0A1G7AWQ4_9PROT|nr:PAS domain-containing hybrid sensor histidine kinase/response regulator [Rhodospira trueperi]SDE19233.1 PAS domain S-box-containing protein [Rhodospira trueperi]